MNQKVLLDSQQFVEKLEGVKAENDQRVQAEDCQILEQLTVRLNKLLQVNRITVEDVKDLVKLTNNVSLQEILQLRVQQSEQVVTVTDLITQLVNLFSSNREAQEHVFECAAHLQAA